MYMYLYTCISHEKYDTYMYMYVYIYIYINVYKHTYSFCICTRIIQLCIFKKLPMTHAYQTHLFCAEPIHPEHRNNPTYTQIVCRQSM